MLYCLIRFVVPLSPYRNYYNSPTYLLGPVNLFYGYIQWLKLGFASFCIMASPIPFVPPDYIGSSPSSTDSKEKYSMNNPNRPTFERKTKSSLRKNLFPGKNPTFFYQTKNVFALGVAKINKAFCDFKCSIQSATQVQPFIHIFENITLLSIGF